MIRAARPADVLACDADDIAARLGGRLAQLEGARVLITGAGGHLAAYAARILACLNDRHLRSPCRLILLVRRPPAQDSMLAPITGRSDVQLLIQNVATPIGPEADADLILHAASPASPQDYLSRPLECIDANVSGTRHVLDLARRSRSQSVLFFSSAEIYGSATEAVSELAYGSTDCLAPRACYIESKRMGETLCAVYHREYATPVKIVRPFHAYGPGMRFDDGRVIAEFLRQRVQGKPIEALSDGQAIRAFCYIADATYGFFSALLSQHDGEAFNIGDDRNPISIRDLAHLIADVEEPVLPVRLATDRAAGHIQSSPSRICPDIGKARRLLDFNPKIDLRAGVLKTLAWARIVATSEPIAAS